MKSASKRAPRPSRIASRWWSRPPNATSARRCASSGDRPSATSRSVSIAIWNRNSSSIRASDARDASNERARAESPLSKLISALQDEGDGISEALPLVDFLTERFAPLASDGVIPRAPIILGRLPCAFDVAPVFQTLQRRIERALVHLEAAAGDLLNAEPNSPPVHWRERQRFEHEQVDAAAERIGFGGMAGCHGDTLL